MTLTKPIYINGVSIGTPIEKTITFSNDTGTLSLFTVTGDVAVNLIPICKTNVASAAAASMELGISTDTNSIISSTLATDLDADEIWVNGTPVSKIESEDSSRNYIVSNGEDIILTLSAQVDSGSITFYCYWTALSSGATVVAA